MTAAPATIWAAPPWDDEAWESGAGEWDVSGGWAVDRKVEYTRTDIHDISQARIAQLEAALFRSKVAWENALEIGLFPKRYAHTAEEIVKLTSEALKDKP
jgi:hypothetical protein